MQQQIARLKEKQRKRETRLKIQIGGLVFTSNLNDQLPDLEDDDGEARAIILGIFAYASEKLSNPEYRSSMLNRGRQVFASKERAKRRFLKLQKQERSE